MTTVSVHEAKTHLSSILLNVERFVEKVVTCRYNKAIAQITPIKHAVRTNLDPELRKVNVKCDLTEATEGEWENV